MGVHAESRERCPRPNTAWEPPGPGLACPALSAGPNPGLGWSRLPPSEREGLKSLPCGRRGSPGKEGLRAPAEKRLGGRGRFGWLPAETTSGRGRERWFSSSSILPSETGCFPRGWSGQDGSAGLPIAGALRGDPGSGAGVPGEMPGRAGAEARGRPQTADGSPRTSPAAPAGGQPGPPCPARERGSPQPGTGPSASASSAAARPDGAPAGRCGQGRAGPGGRRGVEGAVPSLPRDSPAARRLRQALSRPRRRRPGVPCSQPRGCPGAGGEGRGEISRRFAAHKPGDASP